MIDAYRRVYLLPALVVVVLAASSFAGPPSVESVWPPAGQVGKPFVVKLSGANLQTAYEVQFYSPHIRCTDIKHLSEYELQLELVADADCLLENMPFRVLGRDGYSEMLTVRTTSLPVMQLAGDEFVAGDKAFHELDRLNLTICNVAKSSGMDRYRVNLMAGQRLTAEVEAIRLGHQLLDMVLTVIGPDKQTLAHVDDTSLFGQDPLVSFVSEQAGVYELLVHEANYQGGDSSHYLLHIGDFPPPTVVYPAGGPAGSTVEVAFLGHESDTPQVQVIDLPGMDQAGTFQLFNRLNGLSGPSPVPFRLSTLPNVLEREPNDEPGDFVDSRAVDVPVAFNGILQRAGDVDYFWFTASPDTPLRIEVFADRIGGPSDTLLRIVDARQELVGFNDDWGAHDSRLDFYPPEAGEYALVVTDKLAAGGPTAVYRVEVTPLEPGLVAFLPRPNRMSQQSQTLSVSQGNRALVRLGVRRERVESDVELALHDLPSGVHVSPTLVPGDQFWAPIVVEAASDAKQQGAFARVTATGHTVDGELIGGFEQIVDLVAESADRLFTGVRVDRLAVAVTAPVPFSIELMEPTIPLPRGGSLMVRINVNREHGFSEPIRVEFPFLPPWVVGESFVVIPADRDHVWYQLEARPEAEVRDWPLVAVGRVDTLTATGDTTVLNGREVASQLVGLSVQDAPVSGAMNVIAAEQGKVIEVVCRFERSGGLPESMQVELEGLPNRIVATAATIGQAESEVKFSLELADDAPLGEFQGIQCRFSGELEGQQVSYVAARNTKLLVTSRGKLFRNESGELMTPLEALKLGNKP